MYYLIGDDGKEYGPADAGKVREWIAQSRANSNSRLRRADSAHWQPLTSYVEFTGSLVVREQSPSSLPQLTSQPFRTPTNPMALAGFWLTIVGVPCCCAGIFSLMGLIFSVIGLIQIRENPQSRGKNLAIAGIVIGFVTLAFFVLIWGLAALDPDMGLLDP